MNIDLKDFQEITPRFSYNRNQCLGGGTFGKVYKGWDKQNTKLIAVKIISRKTLNRANGIEKRQIQVMEKLHHPNIIQFYGKHETEDVGLYLFLQLCEEGPLSTYLQKKHLSESQALQFLKQIVQGMSYINQKGIFHRDLKPDNLLLNKDKQLKIADFGTAKQFSDNSKATYRRCTPIYSAPEVYVFTQYLKLGGKYDKKCDVFSVGYILYEMLTGEALTEGIKTAEELSNFLLSKKDQGFKFDHLPDWKPILLKLLDFNIETRASFDQIRQMLKNFKPSSKAIPLRKLGQEQKKYSAVLLQEVINSIRQTEKKNNYLIGLLQVFNQFQQQRSQLLPRVYKLATLYYSLARYCMFSDQGLYYLHNPQKIVIRDKELDEWMPKFTPQDKKKLNQHIEQKANILNKALQQIKSLMVRQIIPQIYQIFKQEELNPQRQTMEQLIQKKNLQKFKLQEFESNLYYVGKYTKCIKNVYKTEAETFVLSTTDLKIYLMMLLLSRKEILTKDTPAASQVLKMDRNRLLQQLRQLKIELNM